MKDKGTLSQFPTTGSIDSEAAQWIMRLDNRDVAEDVSAEYQRWLALSPQHQEAIERLQGCWDSLSSLGDSAVDIDPKLTRPTLMERAGLEVEHRLYGAAAAACLVVVLFTTTLPSFSPQQELFQAHQTDIGGQKTVALIDNSNITLNTETTLEVHYTQSERGVELLHGEAYFEVDSEDDRPFIVHSGDKTITAVGTAFSVRSDSTGVQVIVTEGKVAVATGSAENPAIVKSADNTSSTTEATLIAGERALIEETVEKINVLNDSEIDTQLSWRSGLLTFYGEPLSEVINDVSRYTRFNIILEDPELNDKRFGGVFKIGNVDSLFEAIERSLDVQIVRIGNTVYVRADT